MVVYTLTTDLSAKSRWCLGLALTAGWTTAALAGKWGIASNSMADLGRLGLGQIDAAATILLAIKVGSALKLWVGAGEGAGLCTISLRSPCVVKEATVVTIFGSRVRRDRTVRAGRERATEAEKVCEAQVCINSI